MKNLDTLCLINYGIYIVSSIDRTGKINGFIANALMQVNSTPQTFALSVNKNNLTHQFIQESGKFSVSILSVNTTLPFIGNFGFKSGRDVEKFRDVKYKFASENIPVVLDNAVGYFTAKVFKNVDMGTHTVFMSELLEAEILKDEEPMTYLYYRKVKRGVTSKNAPTYIEKKLKNDAMEKYICKICGYIYDPELGDPDSGVKPFTPFEKLPEGWVCPVCGAGKDQFIKV